MQEKIFSKFPFSYAPDKDLSNLLEIQLNSYRLLIKKGLRDLFDEISPIQDWSGGRDLELSFADYYLDEPKYNETKAKFLNISYEAPLRIIVKLANKKTGQAKEQEVYFGEFPLMTKRGTFIINGVERVVISQLIRSPGIFFVSTFLRGHKYFGATLIPNRGVWLEFETDIDEAIHVKIDRKRKIPVTSLLRIFGLETDQQIIDAFKNTEGKAIQNTLDKDPAKTKTEAFVEIYKRLRPGDLASVDNTQQLIEATFFNLERYDLEEVGRWKLNQRLGLDLPIGQKTRVLQAVDLIGIVREIVKLNNDPQAQPDDIDHLANRRVRSVGELLQGKLRVGLARMTRIIKDRISTSDISLLQPAQLINAKPFVAAVKEFFTNSQLSQFMEQVNPLSELEHKRRISAMGPGGLTKERAGLEVRDVHPTFYGRLCPIQTPEGANIGLVGHLTTQARLNDYGFLITPYRKVDKGRVTDDIVYLDAFVEQKADIAPAGLEMDKNRRFIQSQIEARVKGQANITKREKVQYMDVTPQQCLSVATALIPFLETTDANRALMGSNMQRQAVPCIKPVAPLVGTGMEKKAAVDSGQVIVAEEDGIIKEVDASHIILETEEMSAGNSKKEAKKSNKLNLKEYKLQTLIRTNQFTCVNQWPLIKKNQKIKKGDILADGVASDHGHLALGQNLLVAFLPWRGSNFEDAIIISERVLKDDLFTSIHLENFSCDVRETKLGPEITTPDIPNVGEERLKDLDEEGIVRIGATVGPNDILVGKISPKGEADLTAEERLLRAIFGEKAREVKDTSLRLPHGKRGRIVGIKIFSRERGDKLSVGVIKTIQIEVAQLRKIMVGDKLAGRHGNKGVISKILPVEDLPYLADGTPVDIILNPLGVISRMNIGQILETHLGWVAKIKGYRAISPALDGASEENIKKEMKEAGLPENGKVILYDGQTGEAFQQKVTVGYIYIMKLIHLVEDKIHMRSIGPYSLITQQPLSGKAQFGGQRFGEMEVWALEGYGAAYTLQEMLTIKSDDVVGRAAAYDSIIRGYEIKAPSLPASFNVLVNELKALGLSVELKESKDSFNKNNS